MSFKRIFVNYLWLFPSAWIGATVLGLITAVVEGEFVATGALDGLFIALFYGSAFFVLLLPVIFLVLAAVDFLALRVGSVREQNVIAVGVCGFAATVPLIGATDEWDWVFPAGAMLYAFFVLRLPPLQSEATAEPISG